jgi:hypothetical protein
MVFRNSWEQPEAKKKKSAALEQLKARRQRNSNVGTTIMETNQCGTSRDNRHAQNNDNGRKRSKLESESSESDEVEIVNNTQDNASSSDVEDQLILEAEKEFIRPRLRVVLGNSHC